MPDERDHEFIMTVLNASLALMSILVAVIALLAVAYKDAFPYPAIATPIRQSIWGATGASCFSGALAFLALVALFYLRSEQGNISLFAWVFGTLFGALIVVMTGGIVYVVSALTA